MFMEVREATKNVMGNELTASAPNIIHNAACSSQLDSLHRNGLTFTSSVPRDVCVNHSELSTNVFRHLLAQGLGPASSYLKPEPLLTSAQRSI